MLPVPKHNFTEPDSEFDSYLSAPFMQLGTPTWSSSETGEDLSGDGDDSTEMPATVALSDVIKSLIYFISSRWDDGDVRCALAIDSLIIYSVFLTQTWSTFMELWRYNI